MEKLSYKDIERKFSGDYNYMFNLNPDKKKFTEQSFEKLMAYFKKKQYDVWLVRCHPPNNELHIHYHGMLRIRNFPTDYEARIKLKKAINKQVNLYIGRAVPLERPDSIRSWVNYIYGITNVYIDSVYYFQDMDFGENETTGA